jgi:hypothetical protein
MCKFSTSLILFLIFSSSIYSQKIFLENSFFSGYKYSIDSVSFESIDTDKLTELMGENNESIELLNSYSTNLTISKVFGYPGGFLIGWPLGGYLGSGGEWKDGYTTMLLVGAGLAIVSIVFESTANNKLEESISKYNSSLNTLSSKVKVGIDYNKVCKNISLHIRYQLN